MHVFRGNLYTKDLVDVLKPPLVTAKDFWYTDYITTLIAIVPKNQENEWKKQYESLSENVVPNSAKFNFLLEFWLYLYLFFTCYVQWILYFRQFTLEDKDGLVPWRVGFLKIALYKKPIVEDDDRDPKLPPKKELTPLEAFVLKAREKLK